MLVPFQCVNYGIHLHVSQCLSSLYTIIISNLSTESSSTHLFRCRTRSGRSRCASWRWVTWCYRWCWCVFFYEFCSDYCWNHSPSWQPESSMTDYVQRTRQSTTMTSDRDKGIGVMRKHIIYNLLQPHISRRIAFLKFWSPQRVCSANPFSKSYCGNASWITDLFERMSQVWRPIVSRKSSLIIGVGVSCLFKVRFPNVKSSVFTARIRGEE